MSNIRVEDFTIVISPVLSEDGKRWTGGLYTSIMHNKTSPLDMEDQKSLYGICKLMCNAVILSNIDEDFRDHLEEFTISNDSIVDIDETFSDNPIVERKDNVIKINFKTKTKGNA
mgnify:CR=1 FL=1